MSTCLPRSLFVLAASVLACAPPAPQASPQVRVEATDYAFQVAHELPAGATQFGLDNRGKLAHEMALGQLKAGVSADSVLAYVAQGRDPGDLTDGVVGILIASPGTTALGTLQATLVSGRTYVMICQFRDADSLPPHIAMGMHASFVVK